MFEPAWHRAPTHRPAFFADVDGVRCFVQQTTRSICGGRLEFEAFASGIRIDGSFSTIDAAKVAVVLRAWVSAITAIWGPMLEIINEAPTKKGRPFGRPWSWVMESFARLKGSRRGDHSHKPEGREINSHGPGGCETK